MTTIQKKIIVSLMLILRFCLFSFVGACGKYIYDSIFSSWQCLGLVFLLIVLLDVYDGKIARACKDKKFIFFHRCADGLIDKMGIVIALIGFLYTGRLEKPIFILLMLREVILLLMGCWAFYNNQKVHIRGDYFGKMYYLVLVAFVFSNFPSNLNGSGAVGKATYVTVFCVLMILNIGTHAIPLIQENVKRTVAFFRNKIKN